MIIPIEKGTLNISDLFYESECKRIDMLNREFFHDIELTDDENKFLIWLCGWDNWTIEMAMTIFRKIIWRESNGSI